MLLVERWHDFHVAGDVCVDAFLEFVELVGVFGQYVGVDSVFAGYALTLRFDASFGDAFLELAFGELFGGFACGFGFGGFGLLVGELAGENAVEFLLRVGAFHDGRLRLGFGIVCGVAAAAFGS